MDISTIVDVGQYPITRPDTADYAAFLQRCRARYIDDGVVILPGFLTQEATKTSVAEVLGAKGEEWMTNSTHNVFLDQGDPAFPDDHIR